MNARLNAIGLGAVHVAALAVFLPGTFHWSALIVVAVLLYITGALGITLCYHRALTHRSLRLFKPLEYLFAIFGTLAFQGDPIRWVATHRKHHAHADTDQDPHSIEPGFTWAHVRWLIEHNSAVPGTADLKRYAPDLYNEPFYRALRVLDLPLQIGFAALMFAIGGWAWLVWGVFVRLVISYHGTWLVNSAAHSFGYRTFRTEDRSTNCWWVAIISWGEGWHNNHHAFPYSARHGLRWFEIDVTWWTVKLLRVLRLADRIKLPTLQAQERAAR